MIKIFRKIRQNLIIEHKFKNYLLYAIGEIILVVIGILIAVSINNWMQATRLKKVEQNLYADLLQEFENDLEEVQGNMRYNDYYLKRYNRASEIILNDPQRVLVDTLAMITTELTNFSDLKKEESAYNSLATSGKLELVTNKAILSRMQNIGLLYNYINRLENNHQEVMFTIVPKIATYLRIKPFQIMMPEQLYDYKFHNDIEFLIRLSEEKDGLYKQAETDLGALIKLFEEELN